MDPVGTGDLRHGRRAPASGDPIVIDGQSLIERVPLAVRVSDVKAGTRSGIEPCDIKHERRSGLALAGRNLDLWTLRFRTFNIKHDGIADPVVGAVIERREINEMPARVQRAAHRLQIEIPFPFVKRICRAGTLPQKLLFCYPTQRTVLVIVAAHFFQGNGNGVLPFPGFLDPGVGLRQLVLRKVVAVWALKLVIDPEAELFRCAAGTHFGGVEILFLLLRSTCDDSPAVVAFLQVFLNGPFETLSIRPVFKSGPFILHFGVAWVRRNRPVVYDELHFICGGSYRPFEFRSWRADRRSGRPRPDQSCR